MELIYFKEEPIESLNVWNTPSYVQQNVYGNLRYYPVLEPVDYIRPEDITPEQKKAAMQFKSTREVADAFFQWHPETTGGKLADYETINFHGFKYEYHPNHKTYYGNVDKEYLILSIIARWLLCVKPDFKDDDIDDAHRFPRGYHGGESRGFYFSMNGGNAKDSATTEKEVGGKRIIPMIPAGSAWRAVAAMNTPMCDFVNMDACFMALGIDAKSALKGTDESAISQVIDDKCYVATVGINLTTVSNPKFEKVSESGNVTLYVLNSSDSWTDDTEQLVRSLAD